MDSSAVPLWAFLLTALAAVVGPFVTTGLANRHAERMQAQQHANDRDSYLLNKKIEVYDEILSGFSKADFRIALDRADGEQAIAELSAIAGRLRLYAPPRVVAEAAKARTALGELYSAAGEEMDGAIAGWRHALDALVNAIRTDMESERPKSIEG